MKYFTLLVLLVMAPSYASFKVTVLSTEKPDIKKNEAPVDKPAISLSKGKQSTHESSLSTNKEKPVIVKAKMMKPNPQVNTEPVPSFKTVEKKPAPIERGNPAHAAVGDLSVHPKNKYAELKEIKKAKQLSGEMNKPAKVQSLLDSSEPIKPLFELTQGDTFAGVLERWADTERHRVVFDLGVWNRIQELKMTVNYLFTTELKSSVEQFLDLLNETENLKSNDVTLHACFFQNKYIKVTTNSECEA
jgi:hypothetical protein